MLDPGLKAFGLGAALLAVATAGGVALVMLPFGTSLASTPATAYGITIIAGALSFMILGMLCKIVPFLVWMKSYGPRAGRQPVPLATTLGSRSLENAWLITHASAIVVLDIAVLTLSPALTAIGAAILAAAIFVFLINIARILRHLFRLQVSVASMPRGATSQP